MNYALSTTPMTRTATALRSALPALLDQTLAALMPSETPSEMPSEHGATEASPIDPALIDIAKRLYEMRRVRDELLGSALFSEPAWDILLDLFISDHEHRRLSVSAVCIGARAPSATALRYLTMLQEANLVERTRDIRDGRRSHVRLTPCGRRCMINLLGKLV